MVMGLYDHQQEDIYIYTCTRNCLGLYTIAPSVLYPFTDTYYGVNSSCQNEGAHATSCIVNSSLSVSSFQIMTQVNTILADGMFHLQCLITDNRLSINYLIIKFQVEAFD